MTNNGDPDEQQRGLDASFEESINSSSRTVTIPLREYDKLKEEQHFIKDMALIDIIDNIERLVRALRKHIVRTDVE